MPPTPLATPIAPLTAQTTIDPHTFLMETASLFPTSDDDNTRIHSLETKPWDHISSPASFADVNYYMSQFVQFEYPISRYHPVQEALPGSPPPVELNSPPLHSVNMHPLDAVEDTCHDPTLQNPPARKPSKKVSRPKPTTTTTTRRAKAGAFKCNFDGCTRSYAHSRNLSAHVRLDHSSVDGLFYCSVCQMGFRYSQTRNRHERNYHA
ncbi:hypothetical protein HDU81_007717 [Chytriomyces hyalinus]|nr:hypothetical protein HDU81_007717 [Chytriomyces hyalinus]